MGRESSATQAWILSRLMPARAAACWNRDTAEALTSVAVTRQVGLALRMGSREDPQPHPSSRKCWGGCWMARAGNSSSRYLPPCSAALAFVKLGRLTRRHAHKDGWQGVGRSTQAGV